MICIKLVASNDRNGNPRRVYVLLGSDGSIVRAVDEEYYGLGALHGVTGCEVMSAPVEFVTTPAEYRRVLREYGR